MAGTKKKQEEPTIHMVVESGFGNSGWIIVGSIMDKKD
jgi:hypothetical protein